MESMEVDEVAALTSPPPLRGDQQRVTLMHFMRTAATLHTIDEIFLSFTHLVVHRFGAQVAQIWTPHFTQRGSFFPELRSSAYQNSSLPEHLIVNPYIVAAAERTLRSRSSFSLRLVNTTFPSSIAMSLQHHRLNYYASSFLSSSELLPPTETDFSAEQVPTPLAFALLLFFQQVPHQKVLLSINNVFQSILPIAKSRGLLLAAPRNEGPLPIPSTPPATPPVERRIAPVLFELIPHRLEDPADNPLAASVPIAHEHARRFYAAINGRRNVDEIRRLTHLERKEIAAAVQVLLAQHRILFYEPTGEVVKNPPLFNEY
jgi:hypothetical protein